MLPRCSAIQSPARTSPALAAREFFMPTAIEAPKRISIQMGSGSSLVIARYERDGRGRSSRFSFLPAADPFPRGARHRVRARQCSSARTHWMCGFRSKCWRMEAMGGTIMGEARSVSTAPSNSKHSPSDDPEVLRLESKSDNTVVPATRPTSHMRTLRALSDRTLHPARGNGAGNTRERDVRRRPTAIFPRRTDAFP